MHRVSPMPDPKPRPDQGDRIASDDFVSNVENSEDLQSSHASGAAVQGLSSPEVFPSP
jgi:hypothetical protein